MSTFVVVNTYTHSVTYVADKMLHSLHQIIRESGLSPEKLTEDWNTLQRGISTWLSTGHLETVTLEVFDPNTDALVGRIISNIQRRYDETESDSVRLELEEFMQASACTTCGGRRLKPESLAVTLAGQNIGDLVQLSITDALTFFENVPVRGNGKPGLDPEIAAPILKEVRERLRFLNERSIFAS
jgi:excinuclease ABC subunit A